MHCVLAENSISELAICPAAVDYACFANEHAYHSDNSCGGFYVRIEHDIPSFHAVYIPMYQILEGLYEP